MRFPLRLLGLGAALTLLLASAICLADTVPFYSVGNVLAAGNYNHKHGSSDITLIIRMLADGNVVVDENYDVKYFVAYADDPGPADALGDAWIDPSFDDSAWAAGKSGVGYDDADDNTEIDTKKDATGDEQVNAIFTRYRFDLASEPTSIEFLVDYDDAFVIWINGVEVGRSDLVGADPIPAWDVGQDGLPGGTDHGSSELPVNDPGRWTHGDIMKIELTDLSYSAAAAVKPVGKLAITWAGVKSAR
jgi:hypothetical protein